MKTDNIKKIKCGKILENVDLKKYTTYKLESTAKYMVFPKNVEELKNLINFIKENNIKYKIIGIRINLKIVRIFGIFFCIFFCMFNYILSQ